MRWIWSVYFVLVVTAFANWTTEAFTNVQAWGTSITATGTVREHTQVITRTEGTNAPVVWTNAYWRFDAGATSNDYTETDGETYTNLIVDVGVPDKTNTFILRGRDVAMWELYLAQLERSEVVGDSPSSPAYYWHTDYVSNLQARKDWIEENATAWVCTTNADTNGVFDAYFAANTNATTFPTWTVSNLLEYAEAPNNWLDYTPTWPVQRLSTNTVTLSGTNDVVTNAFWFGNLYTNLTGTNGQIVSIVLTNESIADGFSGYDYQGHDVARLAMDALIWTEPNMLNLNEWDPSIFYVPGFSGDTYFAGLYEESYSISQCAGDVWDEYDPVAYHDNSGKGDMPLSQASYNAADTDPYVYALRTYTTNICEGTTNVSYATYLSCYTSSYAEVLTSWPACSTSTPWEVYPLVTSTWTCVNNADCTNYLHMANEFGVGVKGTNTDEAAIALAEANLTYWETMECDHDGLWGDVHWALYRTREYDASGWYTNGLWGVYYEINRRSIITTYDGCDTNEPWYGMELPYISGDSTEIFYADEHSPVCQIDVPTNTVTTNFGDIICYGSDVLDIARDNFPFIWDYPYSSNVVLSGFYEYVSATPDIGVVWTQEPFLADIISTNTLKLYNGQTDELVYFGTNGMMVTTNFVAPSSVCNVAPHYAFYTNETRQWKVDRAVMLYKWQFTYGPTNSP